MTSTGWPAMTTAAWRCSCCKGRRRWAHREAIEQGFRGKLMALQKKDREFRLPKISYLDFKTIEMDRVLTGLFERLEHGGYPSVFRDKRELTVDKFVDDILEASDRFLGFAQHREVVTRWVETHLMDIVNRGKKNASVAGPRPLHGYT